MNKIPVLSIVAAKSGSGKTTLLVKVIKELKSRGYRIATIKHDAHDFEMDTPGKDTWKYAQAGSDVVAITSTQKIAIIEKKTRETTLDEIVERITGVDIILTEGYKNEDKPKIEVFRSCINTELLCAPQELLAIASDIKWHEGVPCYHVDDYKGITDEIVRYIKCFQTK